MSTARRPPAPAVPVEDHAQPLAEDPNPGGPGERQDQGRLDRRAVEQAHADEELDQREEGVPHRDVGGDEVPDVGDEVADDEGLALGVGQDVGLDEAAAEHERLELQGGIEDPEEAQDDLQDALGRDGQGEAAAGPAAFVLLVVALPELVSSSMALDSGYRAGPGWSVRPGPPLCGRCQAELGSKKSWLMQFVGVTATATSWLLSSPSQSTAMLAPSRQA